MLRRLAVVLSACALGMACVFGVVSVLAAGRAGRPTAARPPVSGTRLRSLDRRVPDMPLIDAHGDRTSLAAFRGRWIVLAPSLTLCHEVCPLTTGTLLELRRRLARMGLARRVVVAEATVDPWRDSPARLRAYQRLTGACGLSLLTGTLPEIRRLWRFFGVFFRRVPQGHPSDVDWLTHRPERMDVEHTEALFILDPRGRERVATVGMADAGRRLSPRLRSLLNEQGRANLEHPEQPWTAAQVLAALRRLGLGHGRS